MTAFGPQPVTTTYRGCTISAGLVQVVNGQYQYDITITNDANDEVGSVWDQASDATRSKILGELYSKQSEVLRRDGSGCLALADLSRGYYRSHRAHPYRPISTLLTNDFSDEED